MPSVIDHVSRPTVMDDELSYREPQAGNGTFRMGSIVTVMEHQAAVFVSRGRILDVLGPGQHVLSTSNIPLLSNLLNMVISGRSPFTSDIYFVNMKPLPDVRWGTNPPIELATDDGIGRMFLMGNGVAEVRIADPAVFMQYAMNKPVFRLDDFKSQIQAMLIGQLSMLLSRQNVKSPQEANAVLDNLEGALLALVNEGFARLGLSLTAIEANPFQRKQLTNQEAAQLFGTWEQRMQMEQMDVARTAAGNEGLAGGLAGAGVGFGVGQQLGNAMNPQMQQQMMQQQMMMMQQMQQMQQMMNNQGQPQAQQPAAPAGGVPQTPEEIEAALDKLEMRFMNGEISEETYKNMAAKWQDRLNQMKGGGA